MDLLRVQESCALRKKVQKEHIREIYDQLPLRVMGPGGVEHAWKSLNMMQEGLDVLSAAPVAVDVDWKKIWVEQQQKVRQWCAILKTHEQTILGFERCVVDLRSAEKKCIEHWETLPQGLESLVSQEDSMDVLEQVRLDCLMELEGDKDEENPDKNPYFPFQVRNTARWEYLGLEEQAPLIVDTSSLHKAQEKLLFQVEWLSKIPAMLMECTHEEVQELDVPMPPYQKDEVVEFLAQYRSLRARKKGWGRLFQAKYPLEDHLFSMHQIAKRIEQGQPFVEMVSVEAGRYRLERLAGKPYTIQHDFWISIVPVTEALFSFVSSRLIKRDTPAVNMSWFQALHFCNTLSSLDGYEPCYTLGIGPEQVVWNQDADGYRLPTEFEWEAAAQSGFAHKSTRWTRYLWSQENANQRMNVAKKTPNHRCLYDMLGNVWEWCFDAHSVDVGQEDSDLDLRVVRGGSWRCSFSEFSLGMREGRTVERGYSDVGFRLVRNG